MRYGSIFRTMASPVALPEDSATFGGEVSIDGVRRANYSGKIPVRLTLAQTSLSSATVPRSVHALVSRQTFLHVGLEDAVRKLHEYSLAIGGLSSSKTPKIVVQEDSDDENEREEPIQTKNPKQESIQTTPETNDDASSDTNNDDNGNDNSNATSRETTTTKPIPPYPVCWFEDVTTQQPLRWQYFVGVLFDSLHARSAQSTNLPWEIRLHFRSYPYPRLLELGDSSYYGTDCGVLGTIQQTFRNSLKQGLSIPYGNSKAALNLSKQSHAVIWEMAIQNSEYDDAIRSILFAEDIAAGTPKPQQHPVAESPETKTQQESTANDDAATDDATTADASTKEATAAGENTTTESTASTQTNPLVGIPVRLSLDPARPMIQKRVEGVGEKPPKTLGSLLSEWAPDYFESDANTCTRSKDDMQWTIAGISPPLSTPLLDLWRTLKHPDNFLYICIVRNSINSPYT